MKKKLLILLSVIFTTMSIVGCGEVSGDLTDNDEPETEVSIDNKNSDDLTGLHTYMIMEMDSDYMLIILQKSFMLYIMVVKATEQKQLDQWV